VQGLQGVPGARGDSALVAQGNLAEGETLVVAGSDIAGEILLVKVLAGGAAHVALRAKQPDDALKGLEALLGDPGPYILEEDGKLAVKNTGQGQALVFVYKWLY
jgi:hypothetical protein